MVERLRRRPPVRSSRALGELGLAPLVLLLGQVLEFLDERPFDLLLGALPALLGAVEHRTPRPLGAGGAVDRRAREALRGGPERRPVAERERERLVRVAEAEARGRFCGHGRHALGLQPLRQPAGAGRVEAHRLAAAGDRRQHLRRPVGQQHQDDVGGWLLERLQQRVGRLVVHHVDALEHEDPVRGLERRVRGGRHDRLADVAPEHLVRARWDDPCQVGVRAVFRPRLDVRRVLGAARQQLAGELPCHLPLARARGPVEEVGVRGLAVERGAEHRAGVGMSVEGEHGPLILGGGEAAPTRASTFTTPGCGTRRSRRGRPACQTPSRC